jgi:hypothetical protein
MYILLLENCLEHDILYDFVNETTRYIFYICFQVKYAMACGPGPIICLSILSLSLAL